MTWKKVFSSIFVMESTFRRTATRCVDLIYLSAAHVDCLVSSACTKLSSMSSRAGSRNSGKNLTFLQIMSEFLPHDGGLTLTLYTGR